MGTIKQLLPGMPWVTTDGIQASIADDPVRPELDLTFRYSYNREVYCNDGAIICVGYCSDVPKTLDELSTLAKNDNQDVAVFYTVWSYNRGSGKALVLDLFQYLQDEKPHLQRYVTLSPKTEMAMKFHLRNGAILLSENPESYNFEYSLKNQ